MKNIITVILVLVGSITYAQDLPQIPDSQSMDSLQTKVMKLMDFYDSYEDGSPESLKKAKYNDAVDEISDGTATEPDKKEAYKIIDAYIKGDKALETEDHHQDTSEDFDDKIAQTDEAQQAQEHINQQETMLMEMSYTEFEAYLLESNPALGKKEIKEAYNKMHKDDGQQVPITEEDNEMTPEQEQIWAIEILQDPKNCADFRKAIKILKPEITENEIQEACKKIK